MKYRNQKGAQRLTDVVSYRISASQRAYLEKVADERNIGLGDVARMILDNAMTREESLS